MAHRRALPSDRAGRTGSDSLRRRVAVACGRITAALVHLVRPGGGTAIPGRVVLRIAPDLIGYVLRQPPLGVVIVSGSSGKSTTAALVRAVLERHGLAVLANRRTANIPHGIAAELLPQIDGRARTTADVAVMEVDEGYAGAVAEGAAARVVVLLNVMIDQLHRWQEPELVAAYLARAAAAATDALVVNADDPLVAAIGRQREAQGARVRRFGLSSAVRAALPNPLGSAPDFTVAAAAPDAADTVVERVDGGRADIRTPRGTEVLHLPGRGAHVAADAAAALEAAAALLGDRYDEDLARAAIAGAATVFGREETVAARGAEVELVLTKSPATMQANLDLLDPEGASTMVAIGRDIFDASQLWLADWRRLRRVEVVSGWQAWDAALRLAYDEVEVGRVVEDLDRAVVEHLRAEVPPGTRRRIVMTPESMRVIRRRLRLDRRSPA
jgi:UDP-N-acetylmuramyl tripeptide synthase